MNILGINAFHGDSSAALFSDGQLTVAIEEERLNRMKHWAGFPARSIRTCLAGAPSETVQHVAVSRDPRAHLFRKGLRAIAHPAAWRRTASRVNNTARLLNLQSQFQTARIGLGPDVTFHSVEHHRAHMASAFFASPFEEAAVLSIDGFGDFCSVMWGVGVGNRIQVRGKVLFPHSLGLFYTAFTQYLGFPKYGDEYKMMGLSAYGEPRFRDEVRDVVAVQGTDCRLNLDYFTHHTQGVDMTWEAGEPVVGAVYSKKLCDVFGEPRRAGTPVSDRHAEIAASVQAVLEENYLALLNAVQKATGQHAVCLAGGVALNCVVNGMIFEKTPFRDLYVQPAAHDAGTSIGAALYVQHQILNQERSFVMRHVYFGTESDRASILADLSGNDLVFHELDTSELVDQTARELMSGSVVGWYQGRMEFGPRALGNRSILADPRRADMKDTLNSRIKHREHFRPFCPSILAESTGEFFEIDYPSPFMVQAYRIKPDKRPIIPAVTHADGTGRLQTVERDANPLYWQLISRFRELTGVPVLLNTSFNENEPIVNTPAQAVDCFLRTRMDVLAIGPFLLKKGENAHLRGHGRALAGKA